MADTNSKGQRPKASKFEMLQAQCSREGVDVVAFQETRFSKEAAFPLADYHVLAAPALRGQGGVQLWFSTAPNPGRLTFKREQLAV
eukprot:7464386-Alexandrium_andersonii.AAC.1